MMASLLILGIFNARSAFGQANEPLAKNTDVWSLEYRVSVKGEFEKEPELGSGNPTIFYHINRVYEGSAKLVFLHIPERPLSDIVNPQFKDPAARVHIKIDDFVNTVYDPVCDAYDTIEETWKGEVWSWVTGDTKQQAPALLLIDNGQRNYKTYFPLVYFPASNKAYEINYLKVKYSYPGRKLQPAGTESKRLPIALYGVPNVKGFLKNDSMIRTPLWTELNEDGARFTWLSDILHPDEPLVEGVPDSKDKVNVIIYYSLKRG